MTGNSSHSESGQSCGLFRRLLIMLYDALLVIALMFLAAALALPLTGDDRQFGRDVLFTAYIMLPWFLYLGWCWTGSGQTLGMKSWKVHLEINDGERIGWSGALVRFLVSLLSACCIGLGFAWSLFRKDRQCWHDLASHSRLVVRK